METDVVIKVKVDVKITLWQALKIRIAGDGFQEFFRALSAKVTPASLDNTERLLNSLANVADGKNQSNKNS